MPYLCNDARASFSSILALRFMAVIIAMSYWCSTCCHPFVPLLVEVTFNTLRIPAQQCTSALCASDGRTPSAWNCKNHRCRLMAPNSPDLNTVGYRIWDVMRIVFIRQQFNMWSTWSNSWLTHGTDCRRASLMMLSTNGGRDLGPVRRKTEDISNTCYNNWTWTGFVVQLNLLSFRLCIVQQ